MTTLESILISALIAVGLATGVVAIFEVVTDGFTLLRVLGATEGLLALTMLVYVLMDINKP